MDQWGLKGLLFGILVGFIFPVLWWFEKQQLSNAVIEAQGRTIRQHRTVCFVCVRLLKFNGIRWEGWYSRKSEALLPNETQIKPSRSVDSWSGHIRLGQWNPNEACSRLCWTYFSSFPRARKESQLFERDYCFPRTPLRDCRQMAYH